MARPKKSGRRATGIQGKQGLLYIVITRNTLRNGEKINEKKWIATGLADTPLNVRKATDMRDKLIARGSDRHLDRGISVSDYVDIFLDKKRRDVANTTFASYSYQTNHIREYFRTLKIRDINEANVAMFLDDLFLTFEICPRSVKDIKGRFSALMDMAVSDGLVPYNPVKEVVINKKLAAEYTPESSEDDEFFSYKEVQTFLKAAENHELYELFYMAVFFGLRREEVLGLKWKNIDLENKSMRICHTVTKGFGVNRLNTTKTASSARQYPLTDSQVEMLRHLKKKEQKNRKLFGDHYHENDYVFKHADGSFYYPDYPSKAFKKIVQSISALPQGITFHGLRTSCVSILVHEGFDVKSIQKWVGHKDIETTLKIYAKVKEKEAKQEISKGMDNLIPPRHYEN